MSVNIKNNTSPHAVKDKSKSGSLRNLVSRIEISSNAVLKNSSLIPSSAPILILSSNTGTYLFLFTIGKKSVCIIFLRETRKPLFIKGREKKPFQNFNGIYTLSFPW